MNEMKHSPDMFKVYTVTTVYSYCLSIFKYERSVYEILSYEIKLRGNVYNIYLSIY